MIQLTVPMDAFPRRTVRSRINLMPREFVESLIQINPCRIAYESPATACVDTEFLPDLACRI